MLGLAKKQPASARMIVTRSALQCRRKFLRVFPRGFEDPQYLAWERNYKVHTHEQWRKQLGQEAFSALLEEDRFTEIATRAVRIESRTHLLFSFEKMALRDAVKIPEGAASFATGLYDFLHGPGNRVEKFERWCRVIGSLPRRQSRVLTWPVMTIFGFIAQPERHIYLKPKVTKIAAERYGFHFEYHSRPNWSTYASLLKFADTVRNDLSDLRPRDMIDIQSFIWVQGSDEYADWQ
jgi:hypothetical protein